jgi:hypothetical protein
MTNTSSYFLRFQRQSANNRIMPRNKDDQYYGCLGRYIEMVGEVKALAEQRDKLLESLKAQIEATLGKETNGNIACEFDASRARITIDQIAHFNEKMNEAISSANFYAPNCDQPRISLQSPGPAVW